MSNLLKRSWIELSDNPTQTRIIDTNDFVNKRLESLSTAAQLENRMYRSEPDEDGFSSGFDAEIIDTPEGVGEEELEMLMDNSMEQMQQELAMMQQQAQEILEDARSQAAQIEKSAQAAALKLRNEASQQGYEEGYAKGLEDAQSLIAEKEAVLEEKERQLMVEYEAKLRELEPMFIDNLTSIYEHVFHVELRSYREILSYLIANTMRKIEGSREFYIHVSKEDYPYISMQKKQLAAAASAANSSVEIVEDLTLSKNACMIETEGGVFDCGVDTQLAELSSRLKLLSYERM